MARQVNRTGSKRYFNREQNAENASYTEPTLISNLLDVSRKQRSQHEVNALMRKKKSTIPF